LLVTKQMSPALAARVLASVTGRRAPEGRRLRPFTAILRLATLAFLATALLLVLYARHTRSRQLERDRASLLQTMRDQASALTRADHDQRARVEAALALHAVAAYAGDLIADELRGDAGLAQVLAEPTLYIRGPLEGLASRTRLAQLAPSSWKDAFVLCLLDPPAQRSEAALKKRARAAFSRDNLPLTAHIERLDPLLQALPLLGPSWQERVLAADSASVLSSYRKLFDAAPIAAAVRAAKARQLLAVMDEAGPPGAPTELDGERPHPVRVVLLDLLSGELLLRFRRDVDPSFISTAARAEYAGAIDSCALAFDLHQAAATPKTKGF
jgi:hypothetical protein